MIAVIDYGVGNVFNVLKACRYVGADVQLTADPASIQKADGIILPGVGAFRSAMDRLNQQQLVPLIKDTVKRGTPFLGICLGMQMLFASSTEFGVTPGLGLIPGQVIRLPQQADLQVPQVGWNQNRLQQDDSIFRDIDGCYTYFVHSYYAECPAKYVVASVDYGVQVPAIVQRGNVYGMQFHPEKSGKVGLNLLKAFMKEVQTHDLASN